MAAVTETKSTPEAQSTAPCQPVPCQPDPLKLWAMRILFVVGIIFLVGSFYAAAGTIFKFMVVEWKSIESVFFIGLAAFVTAMSFYHNGTVSATVNMGPVSITAK